MNRPSVHRISSGCAVLATETVGNGTPVIFLHASVCDRRMWRSQLDTVGSAYKAIAYDRRGFGETQADLENFSAVADLMAIADAAANGRPAILVGCSQGGRIAIDAALQHPSRFLALVLIAPSVGGAPEATYPPDIEDLVEQQKASEEADDLDRINEIKARLWLDGPLAPEGRVRGEMRRLFLNMNAIALRSPPQGLNLDPETAFHHLGEITVPSLIIQGNLDFPHIQQRSRHIATTIPLGKHRELPGAAHLPSLERPTEISDLIVEFIGHILSDKR